MSHSELIGTTEQSGNFNYRSRQGGVPHLQGGDVLSARY